MEAKPDRDSKPSFNIDNLKFTDLFDLKEIQEVQDLFSDVHGVASLVTHPDGTPITNSSNFTRLCSKIIRNTDKGCSNCHLSDAIIGRYNPAGPTVQPCLSGGLWDAGVSINVGGRHIANWLIGQVRNEVQDEQKMKHYSKEIGANWDDFKKAYAEVPIMSLERFTKISRMLYLFVNELSEKAYNNRLLEKQIEKQKEADKLLRINEEKFHALYMHMSEGAALHELTYNDQGLPEDYLIIETNPSFDRILGISKSKIVGKTSREAYGVTEPPYFETYKNVALTGLSTSFETYFPPLEKYFSISVYAPYKSSFATIFQDITERKRAEESLRKTNDYLENLINYANAPIIVWDPTFCITRFNNAFEILTGLKEEEVLGKSLKILFPKEQTEKSMEHILRTQIGERWETVEIEIQHSDQSVRTVLWNSANIFSGDSQTPMATIAQGQDITDRKKIETALRDSEAKYRNLVKDMQVGIIIQDPDSRIVLSNPKAFELLGITENQLMGRTSFDPEWNVIYEDGSPFPGEEHPVPQAIATGLPVQNVIMGVFRPATGDRAWLLVDAEPQLDTKGAVVQVVCTFIDISKRKKAQAELKESEEKFRSLFEANTDGITIFQLEPGSIPTKILAMNENSAKMLGYDKEEMLLMNPLNMEKQVTPEKIEARKKKLISQGSSSFETVLQHRNGTEIYVEIYVSVVNYDGQPALMNIVHDLTHRKQIEQKIIVQNQELEKLNAEKDKFFSILAHDLRSPFNGFLGLTQIIAEDLPNMTIAEVQSLAISIRNSAKNLYSLLENLLEWSGMQRGLTVYNPMTLKVMPKISENMVHALESATLKGISISYQIPFNMTVFADANMFGSIVRNLATNAVKFTHRRGKIVVSAKKVSGSVVEFSFKDSGIGMNQHTIDHLFILSVNTSRKGTEGETSTGLGLFICKDFVEKHGGRLWAESEEGIGSTFYFTLPTVS